MNTWRLFALASITLLGVQGYLFFGDINGSTSKSRITGRATDYPFGTGNRFAGGAIPRGLGSGGTVPISILNVVEIDAAMDALATEFGPPLIQKFTTPDNTHGNREMFGWKIRTGAETCDNAYRILINAGIHARERGGPDNLVYFIFDLLWANRLNMGLTYGGTFYTAAEVNTALAAGIVIMPSVNPDMLQNHIDGVTNCMESRKNGNPAGAVDINRNFDFLWDYKAVFDTSVWSNGLYPADIDPDSQTYHGTAPGSEPETRNIIWTMDKFTKLRWFMDIHSGYKEGLILYNWGDDTDQTTDPNMNFQNSAYWGKLGLEPDVVGKEFKEFVPPTDYSEKVLVAQSVATAMRASTGRAHTAQPGMGLYPTCGTVHDYAYSRSFIDPSKNKLHGFTMEFGSAGTTKVCEKIFYPSAVEYEKNMIEVGAGLMKFVLAAGNVGLGDPIDCDEAGSCAATCTPGLPIQCGQRATCETLDPLGGSPNTGKSFCFCQAGYHGTGIPETDLARQYRIDWVNSAGDQSHRVVVNPGQDCTDLCSDPPRWCSNVQMRNECC